MKKFFVLGLFALPILAEQNVEQNNSIQEEPRSSIQEFIEENVTDAQNRSDIKKEEKVELKQNLFEELPLHSLIRQRAEDIQAREEKAEKVNRFFAFFIREFDAATKKELDLLEKVLFCAAHDKDRVNKRALESYCTQCLRSKTAEEVALEISQALVQHEKPHVAVQEMEIVRKTVERLKARN